MIFLDIGQYTESILAKVSAKSFDACLNVSWRANALNKDAASQMPCVGLRSLSAFSLGSMCLGSTAHRRIPIS